MKRILALVLIMSIIMSVTAHGATDTPSSWAEKEVNELEALEILEDRAFGNY